MKIDFEPKSHTYKVNGRRAVSVTTICRQLPTSPHLIRWHIKQGIEEWDGRQRLNEAARQGKLIHAYVENHGVRGWGDDDPAAQRLDGLAASANSWMASVSSQTVEHEIRLGNSRPLYAGTCDAVIGDTLIDFKTGGGPWPERWVQLGGYAYALTRMKREICRAQLVIFKENEAPAIYEAGPEELEEYSQQFLRCYHTYRWLQETEKKWLRQR